MNKKYKESNPDCLDCGKKLSNYNNLRCRICYNLNNKGKNHPSFKKGKPNCKYCNKKLTNYINKTCIKCRPLEYGLFNYIDGRTPLYNLIRNSNTYKEWRNKVFKRDSYTCQNCGDDTGGNLNAHHKIQFNIILQEFLKEYDQFSPIEDKETLVRLAIKYKPFWDIDNGQTLCKKCHLNIPIERN